ncbi:hypothetical protein QWJ17_00250 [Betaproteobacteria bacterium LSUCC0117]|nr:hypothetical protein [Betaproteobacteria bacterium LSUCC0117]
MNEALNIRGRIKIHHYVNLIGWRDILMIMKESEFDVNIDHLFYCDTWSLLVIGKLFGHKLIHMPGPRIASNILDLEDVEYLTSSVVNARSTVLPFFSDNFEIRRYAESYQLRGSNLALGISSPKQNLLAYELAKSAIKHSSPLFNIWCLGAALYMNHREESSFYFKIFLVGSPLRTLTKLALYVKESCLIFFGGYRTEFLEFLSHLEVKNVHDIASNRSDSAS